MRPNFPSHRAFCISLFAQLVTAMALVSGLSTDAAQGESPQQENPWNLGAIIFEKQYRLKGFDDALGTARSLVKEARKTFQLADIRAPAERGEAVDVCGQTEQQLEASFGNTFDSWKGGSLAEMIPLARSTVKRENHIQACGFFLGRAAGRLRVLSPFLSNTDLIPLAKELKDAAGATVRDLYASASCLEALALFAVREQCKR